VPSKEIEPKFMTTPEASAEPIDARLVRELADILNDTSLTEIEVERDGLRIRVARNFTAVPPVMAASPSPAAIAPASASASVQAPDAPAPPAGDVVKSPMVGTVYLQAQPGAPPFAKTGDSVTAGQTLLLIEAMKTMNPITAPRAGKLLQILVADAQPVEYGEPLVLIE
jgi:acetyl-CoA carboxylase biotin carboxyl carrier protein